MWKFWKKDDKDFLRAMETGKFFIVVSGYKASLVRILPDRKNIDQFHSFPMVKESIMPQTTKWILQEWLLKQVQAQGGAINIDGVYLCSDPLPEWLSPYLNEPLEWEKVEKA